MKLIAGLGNPTRRYQDTRHNVGFMVLAQLARHHGAGPPKSKFHAEAVEGVISGQKVLFLSPLTYMNRSGISVHEARDFYKLPLDDILIVCDDLNLPLAKLRCRANGSSGGQKGLADIIARLGSDQFARLRIGIGAPPGEMDASDFVLSKFAKEETAEINDAVRRAADAVACWATDGVQDCMNRYNNY